MLTGAHHSLENKDAYDYPDTQDYQERPSCLSINVPTEFDNRRGKPASAPVDEMFNWANPDALTIRFGYTDQLMAFGASADPLEYPVGQNAKQATERGISFRKPVFNASNHV